MQRLRFEEILPVVQAALAEDVGAGDITTLAVVPAGVRAAAAVVAREPMVVAGLAVAETVFHQLSTEIEVCCETEDGGFRRGGEVLMRLSGPAAPMLVGERVALNLLQRMCGVATLTRKFVEAVAGTGAVILDTRKTTPGLRRLEKYAVVCGGGRNHRFGLADAVLIKDNHLAALGLAESDPLGMAVQRARAQCPGRTIEVETDNLAQVERALVAGADVILLDNFGPDELREAVRRIGGRARTEASGGVNLETVRALAESGVDSISVGALTHSARAVDIALDFQVV